MIQRLAILGVGLIGGSLARALKQAGACQEIAAWGRHEASLQKAQELGVVDRYSTSMAEVVEGADFIVLGIPVGSMVPVLEELKPLLGEKTILTDVGSTKGSVVEAVSEVFGNIPRRFVPGHPIAGTEKSGVEASFAELYEQRRIILTPLDETDPQATAEVRWMWEQCGALVEEMSVQHHDEVLAATSHLPHMLAFTLVDTLAGLKDHDDIFRFAAGGFRDFTRIASSNPQMWHDICLNNKDALLQMIGHFQHELDVLSGYIEHYEGEKLLQVFERAKAARDSYCNNNS